MLAPLPTAWTNLPPASGNQTAANWAYWMQCWYAQMEIHLMIGNQNEGILKHATGWAGGTIGGFSDTSASDGTYTLTDGTGSGSTGWNSFVVLNGPTHDAQFLPSAWDVIISYDTDPIINNPFLQVRTQLVGHTVGDGSSAQTLKVKPYKDYVTCGLIPSINCTGKRFACVHRAGGGDLGGQFGLWPWDVMNPGSSRWPDPPLDREDDKGSFHSTVTSSGITTAVLDSVADTPTKKRVIIPGTLVGKQILFRTDNFVQRSTILSNTIDPTTKQTLITFMTTGSNPSGSYTIGAAGFIQIPGRDAGRPFLWYSGKMQDWYTHSPDDPQIPQLFPTVGVDEIAFCDDTDPDAEDACEDCLDKGPLGHAFNNDLWADPESICNNADLGYQPYLFKSLNGLIGDQEAWLNNFSADVDYPQVGWNPKQGFTVATALYKAGINAGTANMYFDSGHNDFRVNIPEGYEGIYFTVLATNEMYRQNVWTALLSGQISVTGGVAILGDRTAFRNNQDHTDNPAVASDEGSLVVYSAGRTRHYYKMVRNIYTRYGFIVDTTIDPISGASLPIYKPSVDFAVSGCTGIGQFVARPPSGSTMTFNSDGTIGGGKNFQVNDIALYMGESWEYQIDPGANEDQNEPGDLQWHDGLAEAVHPEIVQRKIVLDTTGVASAGTKFSLTCKDKNWYSNWYNGGIQRTESGTVSSATSTSITDSTKTTGAAHCWWQDGRWVQGDVWQYFVLELTDTNTTPHTVWKVPITGGNNTTCTINFAAVSGMTPLGDGTWTYNINEPDKAGLARYRNRKCTISRQDGTSFQVVIETNDANTLFFPAQSFPIQEGWRFKIDEIYPGSLVKWDGTKWNLFAIGPVTIPPDIIKGYGNICKFDIVGIHNFDEFRRVNDLLYMTRTGGGWGESRFIRAVAGASDTSGNPDLMNRSVRSIHEAQGLIDAAWPGGTGGQTDDTFGGSIFSLTGYPDTSFGAPGNFIGEITGSMPDDSTPPQCLSLWSLTQLYDAAGNPFEVLGEAAEKNQMQTKRFNTGIPTLLPATVSNYAYSTIDSQDNDEGVQIFNFTAPEDGTTKVHNVFDFEFTPGATPLVWRDWVKWDSGEPVNSDGTAESNYLGDLQLPGWIGSVTAPDWYSPYTGSVSATATEGVGGYYVAFNQTLVRWNRHFHK